MEAEAGGNPKHLSAIYDYYDNITLTHVLYDGWLTSSPPTP